MRPRVPAKLRPWIVLGGYALAVVGGIVASTLYDLSIPKANMDASGGMYAFGSVTLGFAVFGAIALVPTGYVIYSLRVHRSIWSVLAVLGFVLAFAGLPAAWFVTSMDKPGTHHPEFGWLVFPVMLRLMATPFQAVAWVAAAIFARGRFAKTTFLVCAAIEASLILRFVVHMAMHWAG